MLNATRDHFGGVVRISQLCVDPRGSMYWEPSVGSVLTKPINLHCSVDILAALD